MYRLIKRRMREFADTAGWKFSRKGNERYEKDGYEIYFFDGNKGFELTTRNPETRKRETVLRVSGDKIDTTSPLYAAAVEHVLINAETIVSKHSN